MSLSPDEKLKHLFKGADFYYSIFKARRDFEWKITLGLWGVLFASMLIARDLTESLPEWAFFVLAAFVVFVHAYWLWSTWRAHRQDKDSAFAFSSEAASMLEIKLEPFVRKDVFKKIPPVVAFQLSITIVLVILIALVTR